MNQHPNEPKQPQTDAAQDDKLRGEEIHVDNRFVSKLSNFWYHYKWHVIIIAFFVAVFWICFAQCSSNEKEDIVILFAGPDTFTSEENAALLSALGDIMPRDFDGNGKKTAVLHSFVNYSESDLQTVREREIAAHPDEDVTAAVESYISQLRYTSNSAYNNYTTAVGSGDSAVLLISESLYEKLRDNGRLEPLENVLDSVPETALDGYAVRITDTAFYKNYDAAKTLPEVTVICCLKQPILGAIHDDTQYQNAKEMIRAIVGS